MNRPAFFSVFAAASIGAFYSWVALQFWAAYSVSNSVAAWLRVVIPPREHHSLHLTIIYLHDAVMNIALAAPFAALLVLFTHQRKWLCLTAAVAGAVVVGYWGTQIDGLAVLVSRGGFWMGVATSVLSLPIAFLLVQAAQRRLASAHASDAGR